MKSSSAKSKGRVLQQWLAALLLEVANDCQFPLTLKDVRSTSMGVGGPDLQLSEAATLVFPFDFECKNEGNPLNIYGRFFKFQNKHTLPTIAVFKRTSRRLSTAPVIVLSESTFIRLRSASDTPHCLDIPTSRCDLHHEFEESCKSGIDLVEYFRDGGEEPIVLMTPDRFKAILTHWLNRYKQ